MRRARVDLEAVALSAIGVGALNFRIAKAGFDDGAFGVVDDDAGRHGSKPFEGAAVAAEPGGDRLVPDKLDILVTREAEGHDERPGPALPAGGMFKHWPGPEIDLGGFAGCEVQADRGLWRNVLLQAVEHATHGRVMAGEAIFALQDGMNDDAGNALRQPAGDPFPMWLKAGNGGGRPFARRQRLGNCGIVGCGLFAGEPVSFAGQQPQIGSCPSAHEAVLGNVAVRIALPHTQQGLSVVVHFDLPSTHRFLGKNRRG